MQPNEQNPGTDTPVAPAQNPAQPLPYAVPEYLHLDPVTGQAKRSFKKPIFITLVVLLVISIVGIAGYMGYQVWQYNQPEARFYRALDNQMQRSMVDRMFTNVDTSKNQTVTVKAQTVFGDWSSVKTSLSYTNSNNGTQCEQVLDSKTFSLRCQSPSESLKSLGVAANTWYQTQRLPDSSVNKYDELGLQSTINSPFDVVPIGVMSQQDRDKVLGIIKNASLYTIDTVRTDTLSSKKVDVYRISIDSTKINAVWQAIATSLNITEPYRFSAYAGQLQKADVWVDDAGQIVKVDFAVNANRKISITYSTDTNQTIATPQGAKQLQMDK